MRIDKYLFEKGLAKSRSYAATLITDGKVYCNGKLVTKPSLDVNETDEIELRGEILCYVSRGGLKLERALEEFEIDPSGLICADIGSSTGGFTDCLLQNGALRIYAIDSGSQQLHESLRCNERVVSMENTNVRYMTKDSLPESCDLAVCDVSFISQTLLHQSIASLLKNGASFVSLIKPQFECGRQALNKNGIVKTDSFRNDACNKVIASASYHGFELVKLITSPIEGGDGNIEFLAHFRFYNATT